MRKDISFGKVDYNKSGRKNCEVCIEVELKELYNGEKVFSICGEIRNPRRTDIYFGGQWLGTLKKYIGDNKLFNELYPLWKKYHLNGLNAGTLRAMQQLELNENCKSS